MFVTLAVVTKGYELAFEVLGGAAGDDLLSPEQKRKMEDAKKRKRMEIPAWPRVPKRPNSYLPWLWCRGCGNHGNNKTVCSEVDAGRSPPQ